MKALARQVLSIVLAKYEIYRIYRIDRDTSKSQAGLPELAVISDVTALCNSDSPILRRLSQWGGEGATGFVLADPRGIVGACWYWHFDRYTRDRNFWPLERGDAKLVEIGVREDLRGAGYATQIIRSSAAQMFGLEWERLFARIWYNHEASLKAFEKAGWRNVALVVTLRPRGLGRTFRFDFTGRLACRRER